MHYLMMVGPVELAVACCGMVWCFGTSRGFWAAKSEREFKKSGMLAERLETVWATLLPWVAVLMLLIGLLAAAFFNIMAE